MNPEPTDERSTFLRVDEVLERTERYLQDAANRAGDAHARVPDERVRLLLDTFETRHRGLERAIADYRDGASDELLGVFTQSTVEFPDRAPELPDSLTVESVTDWAVDVNTLVRSVHRQLGSLTISPSVEEALSNLGSLADAKIREAARTGVEAHDV